MTRLILFFLISLLAVCKAPAYYLWLLAIVVTEYPLIFVTITAALTAWGYWVNKYQVPGTYVGIITLLLFLSPIIRAQLLSEDMREDMAKSFTGGGSPPIFPGRNVFSFGGLLKSTPALAYKTITYAKYPEISLTLDFYTPPKSSPRGRTSEREAKSPLPLW
ncbi:MAG: lip2, partial [Chitinophagaceae bacterium]|nr:lip2 [Chitinophagaceae bacterium]